jgi:hypothetical protein
MDGGAEALVRDEARLTRHEMVERVEQAQDFSKDLDTGIRQWLQFRKGHLAEAAALLPKASGLVAPTAPMLARVRRSEYLKALTGFRNALPLAQLGRSGEARQAYAEGLKNLGPSASVEQPRDLGESYARWYLAEAHRREAEELFKAKGIAIPDGALPSK